MKPGEHPGRSCCEPSRLTLNLKLNVQYLIKIYTKVCEKFTEYKNACTLLCNFSSTIELELYKTLSWKIPLENSLKL